MFSIPKPVSFPRWLIDTNPKSDDERRLNSLPSQLHLIFAWLFCLFFLSFKSFYSPLPRRHDSAKLSSFRNRSSKSFCSKMMKRQAQRTTSSTWGSVWRPRSAASHRPSTTADLNSLTAALITTTPHSSSNFRADLLKKKKK